MTPGEKNRFLENFVPFQRRIARIGTWNSLSQTLLKLTCPGVPDIYQGNEWWDFSLVDPDNRRPVDFSCRQQAFANIRELDSEPHALSQSGLLETPEDGRLKLYMTWKALCLRRQQHTLFEAGEYLPLPVAGTKASHLVAFTRNFEATSVLVVVPRLVATLLNDLDLPPIGPNVWGDTHVLVPSRDVSGTYRNAFTGAVLDLPNSGEWARVDVAKILAEFPVALCLLG